MKRRVLASLLACVMLVMLFAGCAGNTNNTNDNTADNNTTNNDNTADNTTDNTTTDNVDAEPSPYEKEGLVWNEATQTWRFTETRKISVEVYDRTLDDGRTKAEDNYYTKWIEEGVMRDHNIELEWHTVPRFADGGEASHIVTLMAANAAPDICYTYNYQAIQEYYDMGGVIDMEPYIDGYKDLLPDLWNLLGADLIHFNQDPDDGHYIAIEGIRFLDAKVNTFVREDWLTKLQMNEPTTEKQFEDMLVAFKDNAELLLGNDASKLIPFSLGSDVAWRAMTLLGTYVPDAMTDKESFIYGFDDRNFLFPNFKEGVRTLNKWYNMGLIWKDFSLYEMGDPAEDNNVKAGYVGSWIHNWDYPYLNGDKSIISQMKVQIGPEAEFIAVDCFQNDAGKYIKFIPGGNNDKKIFFTATNKEPLASSIYLNWLSVLENRKFLSIGNEGVVHTVTEDGAIKVSGGAGTPEIQNSLNNLDYTMTINGLDLGDVELNAKSLALGYDPIAPRYIEKAYIVTQKDKRLIPHYNVGKVESESGMTNPLRDKRDALLNLSVNCKPDEFDKVWDSGFKDYLSSGGQAIIDERTEKFAKYFE